MVDIDNLKPGDTVHVEGTIREVSNYTPNTIWVNLKGGKNYNYYPLDVASVVKHIPKPLEIKVGDIVFTNSGGEYTVLGFGEYEGNIWLMVITKTGSQQPFTIMKDLVKGIKK